MAVASMDTGSRVVQALDLLLLFVTIAAAALAVWFIVVRPAEGHRPAGGAQLESSGAIATAGVSDDGLPLGVLDSWVVDVHTLGGCEDLSEHVGSVAVVVADSTRAVNDVAL